MFSWAEEVEKDEEAELQPAGESVIGDKKTVTEYKTDEEGRKVRVTRFYKMERKLVSKSIARRKALKKYGLAASDPPGPNPANTIICEELFVQFLTNKEEEVGQDDDILSKLKGQKMVKCRLCRNDHWTTQCPFKDKLGAVPEKEEPKPETPSVQPAPEKVKAGKYIPPSMREGASKRGESMTASRGKDDNATIRVTNLCEDVKDSDLQELFRPFGSIARIYLAKDKATGLSKGFAFVSFHRREDAAHAISKVHGFGYAHLILSVEWAKMNIKTWAIVFVTLISCQYVTNVAIASGVGKQQFLSVSRLRRNTASCSIAPEVTPLVDQAIDRSRRRISNRYDTQDHSSGDLNLKSGFSEGWQNCVRSSPIIGSCHGDTLRLFVEISFLSVTVNYTMTLLDNLLGGLLGGLLSALVNTLTNLLGSVTSLLLRVLAVDIRVLIALEQKLISGAKCSVTRFKISRISSLKVLNLDLTVLANLLEGLLGPILNVVLNLIISGPIQEIFVSELSQISIPLNLIRVVS